MFDFSNTLELNDLTFKTDLLQPVSEKHLRKMMTNVHPHELALLRQIQADGGVIRLNYGNGTAMFGTGENGYFEFRFTLYPWGRLRRGAIVHEYTHYQQWRRGDLEFHQNDTVTWKGERHPTINTPCRAYMDQPWEVEAHMTELTFVNRVTFSLLPAKVKFRMRRMTLGIIGDLIAFFNSRKTAEA